MYGSRCVACDEGRDVGGQHRIELLDEEEREHMTSTRVHDTGNCRLVSTSDFSRQ